MLKTLQIFFKYLFECKHKNALITTNEGFCPDCGQFVKKNYYIVRCPFCGFKRSAKKSYDKIIPCEKFCTNCGEQDFTIEKYDSLNLVDINYAIEIKETVIQEDFEYFEIKIEDSDDKPKKQNINLLPNNMKLLESK